MIGLTHRLPALRRRVLLRRCVYVLFLATLWAVIVGPTYIVYKAELDNHISLDPTPPPASTQYLNLTGRVLNVDPIGSSFQMSVLVSPSVNPDAPQDSSAVPFFNDTNGVDFLTVPVTIAIQSVRVALAARDRPQSVDGKLSFVPSAGFRGYPFDRYTAIFSVYVRRGDSNTTMVPLQFGLSRSPPGFTMVSYKATTDDQQQMVSVSFTLRRSGTTIGFSVFVIFLMWVLSLVVCFLALQIVLGRREAVPPLLAVPTSMLFALPSLRNVQPGVPPVGVTADVVGFFWNMFIVAISAVTIMLCYLVQQKKPDSPAVPSVSSEKPLLPMQQQTATRREVEVRTLQPHSIQLGQEQP
ncbi:hypothetical protein RI367_005109 [Sorochytrium milnesiophthora]